MSFSARAATASDYPLFARLFPELFVDDPLLTLEQFAARMLPRVLVLADAGVSIGYASWQAYGVTGHVVHLVVDPAARGRHAGQALLEAVRERMVESGCTRWYLNVKQGNTPAVRLYERCGMTVEQEGWAMLSEWSGLAMLPESRTDESPFIPEAADDESIGEALSLDPPRLRLLRARAGVVLRGLRKGGAPVAFAAFDPSFPGVYPLRLAGVELASSLFATLREHAKEDRVSVFVEGDPALRDALALVGARVSHSLFRMGASLL